MFFCCWMSLFFQSGRAWNHTCLSASFLSTSSRVACSFSLQGTAKKRYFRHISDSTNQMNSLVPSLHSQLFSHVKRCWEWRLGMRLSNEDKRFIQELTLCMLYSTKCESTSFSLSSMGSCSRLDVGYTIASLGKISHNILLIHLPIWMILQPAITCIYSNDKTNVGTRASDLGLTT